MNGEYDVVHESYSFMYRVHPELHTPNASAFTTYRQLAKDFCVHASLAQRKL